jgi:hypothetical protein
MRNRFFRCCALAFACVSGAVCFSVFAGEGPRNINPLEQPFPATGSAAPNAPSDRQAPAPAAESAVPSVRPSAGSTSRRTNDGTIAITEAVSQQSGSNRARAEDSEAQADEPLRVVAVGIVTALLAVLVTVGLVITFRQIRRRHHRRLLS